MSDHARMPARDIRNNAALSIGAALLMLLVLSPYATFGAPVAARISAAEAKAVLDGSAPYVLLDVRTQEEFDERHIPGALLLPYTEIRERAAALLPADKDALILVYCRSGRRSAIAASELILRGYTNVHDLGGINEWPYETVSTAQ